MIKCKDTNENCLTYSDYLRSVHWENLKTRYRLSKLPQFCCSCGSYKNLDMHHTTYKRIGNEHLCDILPLCRECHNKTHDLLKNSETHRTLRNAHKCNRIIKGKAFKKLWSKDRKRQLTPR